MLIIFWVGEIVDPEMHNLRNVVDVQFLDRGMTAIRGSLARLQSKGLADDPEASEETDVLLTSEGASGGVADRFVLADAGTA